MEKNNPHLRAGRSVPNWLWLGIGVVATHIFWALVIAGWWSIVLKNSDPHDREAFERDLAEIRERTRETIARARKAILN